MSEEEAIVNLRTEPIFWFTCHLQEIFIIQKKYPVKAIAKELGVSQDSLYRYIRGELQFPFRLLIPYLKATIKLDPEKKGDITILNFIANEIDHSIIPRLDFKKGYLYQKYIIEKLSTCKLAEENQCSSTCIIKALKRNGIPLRSLSEARKLRITSFETRQKMSRSLSGCNAPWYGKYGEKSSNWKGGRFEHNGYIYIFNNQKRNKNVLRYIAEHRLIAEHILGRSLHKNEQVHHINENRGDNRNCNLLICTRSYHGWLHKKMNAQNSSVSRLANSNRGKE